MTAREETVPGSHGRLFSFLRQWQLLERWPLARMNDLRVRAAVSIVVAGLLMGSVGWALDWSSVGTFGGACVMSFATWFSRSLVRALYCFIAAFGALAILISVVIVVRPSLLESVGATWTVTLVIFWLFVVAGACVFRVSNVDREFGWAELVGALLSITIAVLIAVKMDFTTNLFNLLLHGEDNAGWFVIAGSVQSTNIVGPGFGGNLGPILPLLLGFLNSMKSAGVPDVNVPFSAFALGTILTPIVAASLLRRLDSRGIVGCIVFPLLVLGWAFVPVSGLFAYGHLTAMLAFVFALCAMSFLVYERSTWSTSVVGVCLMFVMGAIWFPVLPLGALFVVVIGVRIWRQGGLRDKAIVGGFGVAAVYLFYRQSGQQFQFSLSDGLASAKGALSVVYLGEGGTQVFDGLLLVLVVVGVAAVQFLPSASDESIARFARMLTLVLGYITAVYLLGSLLEFGFGGYGPKKLTYVLGWVLIVGLVALAARIPLRGRSFYGVLVVLVFGSLVWGGTGVLVARAWPGTGAQPGWAPIVQSVIATQKAHGENRVLGCLSADSWETYMCSRWAESMTSTGSGSYGPYRGAVVTNGDVASVVRGLVDSGAIAQAGLIVLSIPPTRWSLDLIAGAGQVYDSSGQPVDGHTPNTPWRWGLVKDTRWAKPTKALVDALLAKPPVQGVSEIICYGSDPAELSACSYFATEQLGKKSSALPDDLVTGAEQTVLDAKAAGTLDDVVILVLDLPPKEDLLPYQKVLFASVEAVYQATPAGGLRRVPDSSW